MVYEKTKCCCFSGSNYTGTMFVRIHNKDSSQHVENQIKLMTSDNAKVNQKKNSTYSTDGITLKCNGSTIYFLSIEV